MTDWFKFSKIINKINTYRIKLILYLVAHQRADAFLQKEISVKMSDENLINSICEHTWTAFVVFFFQCCFLSVLFIYFYICLFTCFLFYFLWFFYISIVLLLYLLGGTVYIFFVVSVFVDWSILLNCIFIYLFRPFQYLCSLFILSKYSHKNTNSVNHVIYDHLCSTNCYFVCEWCLV